MQVLLQNVLQQLVEWMKLLAQNYGYFGIFLISLIGALSIFFPLPYTVVIFTLGGLFDPFLIAIAAGLGSAVGEFSGYLLGYYGRKVISQERRRKMVFMVKVFDRFGPITIFLFALTPLPDDLLFIPLGIMRYSLLRAFIPALIGKVSMNFIVAYSGRHTIQIIKDIFGEGSDWIAVLLGGVLGIGLLIIVMVVMFKVDWEKIFTKYVKEKEKKTK
ncbi:MAG: VTT domain-containing protein [Candidatus Bathyarchaeota archaeon]|nr:VTT domain-containing protein [Candidatus Bathyarchaeota archaeon]MDH5532141.1 VTT domain-containing protein [Candidatus Bathyarchaeota archaeon]MDH5713164.1 VTT domain-containing protein [Candidatus Bathyarchaeota archaeon]